VLLIVIKQQTPGQIPTTSMAA